MKKTIRNVAVILVILAVIVAVIVLVLNRNGEKTISNEEIIANIQTIEQANNQTPPTILQDNVGAEIFGDPDYFSSLEVETIGVSISKSGSNITITPTPDFLNTKEYHYYEDGTLALYVSTSNTIEGQIKYYFYNGKLVDVSRVIEDGVDVTTENETEILQKAKLVYDKYMK